MVLRPQSIGFFSKLVYALCIFEHLYYHDKAREEVSYFLYLSTLHWFIGSWGLIPNATRAGVMERVRMGGFM